MASANIGWLDRHRNIYLYLPNLIGAYPIRLHAALQRPTDLQTCCWRMTAVRLTDSWEQDFDCHTHCCGMLCRVCTRLLCFIRLRSCHAESLPLCGVIFHGVTPPSSECICECYQPQSNQCQWRMFCFSGLVGGRSYLQMMYMCMLLRYPRR